MASKYAALDADIIERISQKSEPIKFNTLYDGDTLKIWGFVE